ncbi:phage repressor protein C with HTH and peptisase S24 domain [Rhizobium skierniewicense]|uniref:Phage repressor protein C with HTH and peptisase S24 domain n=1 Tax=Rhizobium skierniewicense TaxID=984260 RepID=A0A7W6G492_9HYPH|nr:LexA family transcriptional regulator [Rhizobium skierniewicense]MBB3947256.1 phage repressor protein C with HTH and peptisase S24 domain [Rhizobium skierniewicense]
MTGTTFAERLNLAIGENVHAFARKANLSDSTLRQYLKGSMPGLDKLIAISEASGVTLDWLAADRGPMRLSPESHVADIAVHHADGTTTLYEMKNGEAGKKAELTLVPRFDISASAGGGQIAYQEQAVELIAFQSAWLRSIGVSPDFARIITARGDSMEPTIRDGDQILIDTSVEEVRDNGIYCVVYGNMLLVKRVHPRMNGSLQLISDNDVYPPEEVSAGDVASLSIAGRVRWFGRNL